MIRDRRIRIKTRGPALRVARILGAVFYTFFRFFEFFGIFWNLSEFRRDILNNTRQKPTQKGPLTSKPNPLQEHGECAAAAATATTSTTTAATAAAATKV